MKWWRASWIYPKSPANPEDTHLWCVAVTENKELSGRLADGLVVGGARGRVARRALVCVVAEKAGVI